MVVYLRKQSHNRLSIRLCKKLRNRLTCRPDLHNASVGWSSPVATKVWIKPQKRVEKGQKMYHPKAIATGVVDIQRHHCLSVYSADTWEKSRFLTFEKNLLPKTHPRNQYFYHALFEAWFSRCSPNSDLGLAQNSLKTKRFGKHFYLTTTCCIAPNGDVNVISTKSQKFFSYKSGVLQILYIFPLIAASAVALNEHRRILFLYSFATKCMNMAVIYILYALKLKHWLRSNSVSWSFYLPAQLNHTHV